MSSTAILPEGCLDALHHVKETREINTVILQYGRAPAVLEVAAEANLTHDELIHALPADEPRLVVHELCFAAPDGARRNEQLLILWVPPGAISQEATYTDGYTALKELLTDVHVHLTARRTAQLEYRRLVALAG
ncbi:cofilin family protein [Streptomyces sp. NPDC050448]|uniref:cofilin family protein n=1 Tax=Streptomyces sp. NPDC050448 TaxID=3155404 RepID=UPI003416779F